MMRLPEEAHKHIDLAFIFDKLSVHTPFGERLKRQMKPWDGEGIEALENAYTELGQMVSLVERHRYEFVDLRNQFKKVKDLRGTLDRLTHREVLSTTELFEIKVLSLTMTQIHTILNKIPEGLPSSVVVETLEAVNELLDPGHTGVGTFYIYDDYSDALRSLRQQIRSLEDQMGIERKNARAALEEKYALKIRPNGELTVLKDQKDLIAKLSDGLDFIYSSETYMNLTFKMRVSEAHDSMAETLETLKFQEEEEEFHVRKEVSHSLMTWVDALEENGLAIGRLDLLLSKAYFAIAYQCVRPVLTDEPVLIIEDGRHLKVENMLKTTGKTYEPVSVSLKAGVTCITGANMGGKTVTLKMIGLLTAMAQYGLFVPAASMTLSPRAYIFTVIGDMQDIDRGLSTFGAEIVKVRDALKIASLGGIILIDELARGTNPKEGYALSRAIIDTLKGEPTMTVITTHFDGLADTPEVTHLQVMGLSGANFNQIMLEMEDDPERGIELLHESMDYRLKTITSPEQVPKDAINIAKLMGLEDSLLEKAKHFIDHI